MSAGERDEVEEMLRRDKEQSLYKTVANDELFARIKSMKAERMRSPTRAESTSFQPVATPQ